MNAKLVDGGALSCSRHTADAYAHRISTVGQTFLYHLLCLLLVAGVDTLYQGDCLTENGDIALDNAFYHVGHRQFLTFVAASLEIGVDGGGLLYAGIDGESLVFFAVFWMFHDMCCF